MTLKKSFAIGSALLMASAVSAATFGYSDGTVSRSTVFRVGTSDKQGLAIKLDRDKLAMFKGKSISGLQAAFGSSRTTGGTADIFITTDLASTPLTTSNVKVSGAVKWIDLAFDAPYVITGEEDALYIGYTADIAKTANLLMSDFGEGFDGLSFAFGDGAWTDLYDLGRGNASVRAIIDDAPAVTDIMIKPVKVEGYFKVGDAASLGARIFNFGSEEIKSFDVEITAGKNVPIKMSYDNLSIPQGGSFDVSFPEFDINRSGLYSLCLDIVNVNGGKEMDPADNRFDGSIFFYPADMERSVLLEGFTGQDCHNCPTGHATINAFVEGLENDNIIEVMHHAGYQPDIMTMDGDVDYTYFYGSSSTYAPAVMLNRTRVASVSSFPVMNTSSSNISKAYKAISDMQPYVSLSLETTYDPATRLATVKVKTYNHNDLPAEVSVINVMLVQDGITAYQSPVGDNYKHNGVFRGALTGNSWGLMLDEENCLRGGSAEWSYEFTLPETIFSDYWTKYDLSIDEKAERTIAVKPENMRIVAYVAAHGATPNELPVYNAIQAPLGKSYVQNGYSGVESIQVDALSVAIRVVDGFVKVDGDCDSLAVYSVDGRTVNAASRLNTGMYIVRARCNGNVVVKKILVK